MRERASLSRLTALTPFGRPRVNRPFNCGLSTRWGAPDRLPVVSKRIPLPWQHETAGQSLKCQKQARASLIFAACGNVDGGDDESLRTRRSQFGSQASAGSCLLFWC